MTFRDGHVELYWCDRVKWEEECRRDGRKVQKNYRPIEFKAHDGYENQPRLITVDEESGETSKTIDARISEIAAKRQTPWKVSMKKWAERGIARRQKKEAQLQTAKDLEEKLKEASNK